ncbi:MAG: hypothetical protein L0154_10345, partial [Chloroflexi bacterium]|nr:hypothetical protein [Chloroflexota bacterium]
HPFRALKQINILLDKLDFTFFSNCQGDFLLSSSFSKKNHLKPKTKKPSQHKRRPINPTGKITLVLASAGTY